MVRGRETAAFTIFFRSVSGEGGYGCGTCGEHRHDTFRRLNDVFAIANQHMSICRAVLRHRPVEGTAIVDGRAYAVVLRDGLMILALPTVFETSPYPVRMLG
jgi:hypothetical protein